VEDAELRVRVEQEAKSFNMHDYMLKQNRAPDGSVLILRDTSPFYEEATGHTRSAISESGNWFHSW